MRRQENVSGITTIKHSLRYVDSRSCKVRFVVNIGNAIDRTTVNPHPQPNMRMILQGSADLQSAAYRLLRTVKKKQCHPVSRLHSIELAVSFRSAKTFGTAHDLIQSLQQLNLFVDKQLRVTHHID